MFRIVLLLAFLFSFQSLFAQGSQVEFGKNRVQYHRDFDDWSQYESQNFITYWYGQGRNIGQATVMLAETDFEAIQNILEHRMNEKIEIIVYKDLTDLKQSNIGSEEAFVNTGGQTKIVGNKIFIYFNGDHNDLRRQIREGISSVYLNAMLFGSNLQEIVQNAVMMNLPEWFKQGLVAYIGEEWNSEMDNQLRDIFIQEKYESFADFAEEHPKMAGHSFWYFISQNYGKSTVSNLLYLTRINRSVESGFLYVLGSSYQSIADSWLLYYNQRYKSEIQGFVAPSGKNIEVKNKRDLPISQLKISPNGKQLVYVFNEIGKYKIYLHDLHSGKREVIMKSGFRNAFQATDYNYPLIDWKPNGLELAVIYEKNDVVKYLTYDLSTKKSIVADVPNQFQRIYSMDFLSMSDLVISASINGFSDIYIFKTLTRQTERITKDFYDDLDAAVINVDGHKGILFASNRQDIALKQSKLDSVLPIGSFDIFFYDLEEKGTELVRVTNTPLANEKQPLAIDSTYYAFLGDDSGIFNRQLGYLEDVIVYYEKHIKLKDGTKIVIHQDSTLDNLADSLILSENLKPVYKKKAFNHNNTNFSRNILEQDYAGNKGKMVQLVFQDGTYHFYEEELNIQEVIPAFATRYQEQKQKAAIHPGHMDKLIEVEPEPVPGIFQTPEQEETPEEVQEEEQEQEDSDSFLFQSEFDTETEEEKVAQEEETPDQEEAITETVTEPEQSQPKAESFYANAEQLPGQLHNFRSSRIIPYRTKFKTDFVTTQLDNSLLFGGLDSYAGIVQEYSPPPVGILFKGNVKDLLEDYEIEGGIRIPTTFNGAEYFMVLKDKKKRLDKIYAFYRRALKQNDPNPDIQNKYRETINLAQFEVRYPLNIFGSLRARAQLRFDKQIQLATSADSMISSPTTRYDNPLSTPSINNQRIGLRLEYVFDNTLDVDVNIKNGLRAKAYVEMMKRFQFDFVDNVSFDFSDGFLTVFGIDGRYYQRLDKHSIWATRLSGATSFGAEKILYVLGGVENWILPPQGNENPFPGTQDFAYQTLASNLRGFRQNIRNGNSFLLLNTELRVPIFKYVSQSIRSSFFRNFQAIGFFDIGTAWQGLSPFNDENPINTRYIDTVPEVLVNVKYFRNPIVYGYGFGIRTMLFGYFLRLDYAWGVETGERQDPRLYFSMGMDF